jgi:hypothetical protein
MTKETRPGGGEDVVLSKRDKLRILFYCITPAWARHTKCTNNGLTYFYSEKIVNGEWTAIDTTRCPMCGEKL